MKKICRKTRAMIDCQLILLLLYVVVVVVYGTQLGIWFFVVCVKEK